MVVLEIVGCIELNKYKPIEIKIEEETPQPKKRKNKVKSK